MIDLPRPLTEQEEIESLAYRLCEGEGRPEGKASEHWAKAIIHAQRLAIIDDSEASQVHSAWRTAKALCFY